jgi:hypothetical protein
MAYYFTTAELRAAYPELANTTRYSSAKLTAATVSAEQWFEAAAHCAFLRRSATAILTGTGRTRLFLPHWVDVGPVSSIKVDGTPLTVGELAEVVVRKYGAIEWAQAWTDGAEIEVAYLHGAAVVPELAKQAVMMLAAEQALPSTIPRRATSLSTGLGNYRISQADKTGKTGIPDVDAIIGLLGADKPVTG